MKKRILAITILITMMLTISEASLTVLAEEVLPEIAEASQNLITTLSTAVEDESDAENEIQLMSTGTYYPEYGIYFDISTGTITDANTSITSIDIHSELDGVAVTSIGYKAFESCNDLIDVTIGENVKRIGSNAFYKCTKLEKINWNAKNVADFINTDNVFLYAGQNGNGIEVVFGDNVEYIPLYAFFCSSMYVPNITSVTIGDSVTSIQYGVFDGCTSLTSVTIGNSVTSIRMDAFSGCRNLTKVNIKSLEQWCMIDFDSRTSNPLWYGGSLYLDDEMIIDLEIPNRVTSIGDFAFYGCTSLTSITIPDNVTSIGSYAFSGCGRLEKINWNARNVDNFSSSNMIFANAGQESDGIQVVFGNNVEYIPTYAFCSNYSSSTYAPNITSVTIGDSVTSIGYRAFYGCTSLISVTIGNNVTSIGDNAFRNCTGLEKINWKAKNVADFYDNDFVFYNAGEDGNGINVVFGNNVERIPAYAFHSSISSYIEPNIANITIGNSVTSIGDFAFQECTGLENIYWNAKNVTDFSSTPFSNVGTERDGTEVIFGNNVEHIPSYLFSGCTGITNITIPDNVTSIGSSAFGNCYADINMSGNTLSVGPGAFSNCLNLNADNLYLTGIASTAFYRCKGLKNITIKDGVTSIASSAFNNCTGLTSVTIPDSITSIGSSAFNNCTGLTDVYYGGTKDEWKKVSIGSSNIRLTSTNIHYLYNTSGGGVVNESRYGDINFKVKGFEDTDDLSIKSEPVANATITVNGVTKTTDANGLVGFSKGEITFDGNLVQVSVSAEGYLDYKNEIILVAYGTNNISMTKKNPDKIYIANLSATGSNGKLYNVMQQNTFTVDKTDTTKYNFKVNMDWNGFEAGNVYLLGAKSGKSFEFINGEVTVSPGVEFDVGENIRVVAYTADESKSTSKENLLNVIALPEDFSLVIPEASTGHLDCIPFLEGKSFTVGFDKGIEKYAGNVEVKDGKLVLDFSDTDNFTQTNKYKIFGENKLSVGPYGKLEIPLYNFQNNDFYGDGEWSGTFGLKTKLTTKAQTSDDVYALIPIVAYNYNTVVMVGTIPVPVTAIAAVEGGVKGELEVGGTLEKANFSGTVEPAVGIDLFGGLGQDYDSVEIKAGVYGELVGRLPVSMDFLNDNISFNPSLEGSLGARASVKVYIVDLEGEFEAGKFKWSKDGFTASWLGNEVMLLSLDNDADNADWQLAGREYLENGGGFIGGNSIALFDLEVTNKDEQII